MLELQNDTKFEILNNVVCNVTISPHMTCYLKQYNILFNI